MTQQEKQEIGKKCDEFCEYRRTHSSGYPPREWFMAGVRALDELRKPSEDIKQTIEGAAAKYAGISDDKFANSAKTYDAYNIDESFKNGAEFALNLSENSRQVDEDLVKKITDILLKNHYGTGFTIPDFGVTAFKIAALIPSSPSGENGDELLEAAKQILDLHVCEMEGLSSGQPTPTEWMNAVDKLSEAISNYEKPHQ